MAEDTERIRAAVHPITRERSVVVGRELARRVFDRRGNLYIVHLREGELAALMALAVEQYVERWPCE